MFKIEKNTEVYIAVGNDVNVTSHTNSSHDDKVTLKYNDGVIHTNMNIEQFINTMASHILESFKE